MSNFRLIGIGILLALSAFSFSKPPFLKVFMETYKISPASALGKSRCLSCHLPPAPPRRNVFGREVEKAMEAVGARQLTAAILKKTEKSDSDGDGFSNLTEIQAGTLPNDRTSKPSKNAKHAVLGAERLALVGLSVLAAPVLMGTRRKKTGTVAF